MKISDRCERAGRSTHLGHRSEPCGACLAHALPSWHSRHRVHRSAAARGPWSSRVRVRMPGNGKLKERAARWETGVGVGVYVRAANALRRRRHRYGMGGVEVESASQTPSTYMRAGSPPVPWTCSRRECGAQGRVRVEETRNCHLRRSHLDRAFPRAAAPPKRAHQERLAVP